MRPASSADSARVRSDVSLPKLGRCARRSRPGETPKNEPILYESPAKSRAPAIQHSMQHHRREPPRRLTG